MVKVLDFDEYSEDEEWSPPRRHLPPPPISRTKTLFLDLDRTLIHAYGGKPPIDYPYHFIVNVPTNERKKHLYYVTKRPGMDEFLRGAAELFEVVIFTAANEPYASRIVDKLDPEGRLISHRLYRDSCLPGRRGGFVKDLSGLGRDLKDVLIVDDKPQSYSLQKANGIPVAPFNGTNRDDRQLWWVAAILEKAITFDDVRNAVALYLAEKGDLDAANCNGPTIWNPRHVVASRTQEN
ncbi:hypothetical protein HPP92_001782 [Vanilla planifolia]|uniref:FCP1 homology domain-containing protein n=1 Tax=Vanilla planifolia TaxID=51239 RepID=A0A835VHK7_VANPL|nr:hypothetical protein HPP92_001996 [Vanilla planifolia]KAG0501710.1 hypothetical protein HPP92_001782 [Vanilla planifolia]